MTLFLRFALYMTSSIIKLLLKQFNPLTMLPCGHTAKIGIIGAGFVGTTFAFAAMIKNLAARIVLVDANQEKCEGEVMDLAHGLNFVETSQIMHGNYQDLADADAVVVCAGRGQRPGETRLDLLQDNVKILKSILEEFKQLHNQTCILVIVANPMDALTYVAKKLSGLPENQVFGSGTVLDSSRLRFLLGEYFEVSSQSMKAYVFGEHGDSEFPVWSHANIGGKPLQDFARYDAQKMEEIFQQTKNAAYEIIKRKNATYYGIALALTDIVESILYDQNKVLPVSHTLADYYGTKDVCLSLPCVVCRRGIKETLDIPLNEEEVQKLHSSATTLRQSLDSIQNLL